MILKRPHDATAKATIEIVRKRVRVHNKVFRPVHYVLLEPKAYAMSRDLIAMSGTDGPSGWEGLWRDTEKGRGFYEKPQMRKAFARRDRLKKALEKAYEEYQQNLNTMREHPYTSGNTFIIGFMGGKFVFVPMLDIV